MKKLGIFLSFIMLALICQNCNNHVNVLKEVGVDYAGVLGYGVNPFDATDSCLYFYSDPADEYGQGRTYVLIQNNNTLISIMDLNGYMSSVLINMYEYNFQNEYKEFPNLITNIDSSTPIGKVYITDCPEILDQESFCLGDNVGIHTGCSVCYCHHSEVPFQMEINGKEYNFMMVEKRIYRIEK